MKIKWTADCIHFMKETPSFNRPDIDFDAPYFALQAAPVEGGDITNEVDYFDNSLASHRYPLILALSILLVDICYTGSEKCLAAESSLVKTMNRSRFMLTLEEMRYIGRLRMATRRSCGCY